MMLFIVSSVKEFNSAHQRAIFEGWRNFIRRHPNNLLPYEPVRQALGLRNAIKRGLQEIEVEKIVGSLGRDREFTPTFLPKRSFTRDRWQGVAELSSQRGFTPILVYKVSDIYFVVDGNHRVSVCRAWGAKTIEAYVIEYTTSVPISKDDDLKTILQKGSSSWAN